jgi:hypothetical protein
MNKNQLQQASSDHNQSMNKNQLQQASSDEAASAVAVSTLATKEADDDSKSAAEALEAAQSAKIFEERAKEAAGTISAEGVTLNEVSKAALLAEAAASETVQATETVKSAAVKAKVAAEHTGNLFESKISVSAMAAARAIEARGGSVEIEAARVVIGLPLLESTILKETSKALASEETRTENNDIQMEGTEQAVSEAIEYARLAKSATVKAKEADDDSKSAAEALEATQSAKISEERAKEAAGTISAEGVTLNKVSKAALLAEAAASEAVQAAETVKSAAVRAKVAAEHTGNIFESKISVSAMAAATEAEESAKAATELQTTQSSSKQLKISRHKLRTLKKLWTPGLRPPREWPQILKKMQSKQTPHLHLVSPHKSKLQYQH